jgi:hypothetical protein
VRLSAAPAANCTARQHDASDGERRRQPLRRASWGIRDAFPDADGNHDYDDDIRRDHLGRTAGLGLLCREPGWQRFRVDYHHSLNRPGQRDIERPQPFLFTDDNRLENNHEIKLKPFCPGRSGQRDLLR